MRRAKEIWLLTALLLILTGKSYSQVMVSLPDTVVAEAGIISLPITIDLRDYAIASYEFEIEFDPQVIEINDVCCDSSLTDRWQQPYINLNIPGKVIAGGYDLADSIRGHGTLVQLMIEILGEPGDHSQLAFTYCKFHGDFPPVMMKNGALRIAHPSGITAKDGNLRFPVKCALLPNYPEPFSEVTTLRYSISYSQYVVVKIFNIRGREVQTLMNRQNQPGDYILNWNARDRFGKALPAGVYLCMLRTEKSISLEKLTLIR